MTGYCADCGNTLCICDDTTAAAAPQGATMGESPNYHHESKQMRGWCALCGTRWPCDYEDMGQEIDRLRVALTAMTALAEWRGEALKEIDSLTSGGFCVVGTKGKDRYFVRISDKARAALSESPAGEAQGDG